VHNINTDLIILGGGLAGCVAALEAQKNGISVVILDSHKVGCSGSTPTSGGSPEAVVPSEIGGDPEDSVESYVKDIVLGGEFLARQDITNIIGREMADTVLELDALGVPYRKDKGKFVIYQTLGTSHARVGRVAGNGTKLMQILRREVLHRGARIFEHIFVSKLFTSENRFKGLYALDRKSGEQFTVTGKAIVITAGSALDLYPVSTASHRNTGDGYILGFEAGCELSNMEFVEFSAAPAPRGVPISSGGIKPTLSAGAHIYNGSGDRFLKKVDPDRIEMTKRSRLIKAVYSEIREGRGPVSVDTTMLADNPTRFMKRCLTAFGVDYTKEYIQILPAAHTFLGGLETDSYGATSVSGIYAAGESSGHAGAFGADRVNGAIGACQVLGKRAGKAAALYCREADPSLLSAPEVEKEKHRLGRIKTGGVSLHSLKEELHKTVSRSLGIIRTGKDLEKGISEFRELREKLASVEAPLVEKEQLKNLAFTGELVARAALERRETRGQHSRSDFPDRDDKNMMARFLLKKRGEDVLVSKEPLPWETYPLKRGEA